MSTLPKSRIVAVEMEIELPVDATLDQIEEWIKMECGNSGGIAVSNPLINYSCECVSAPMLTDTRQHLHSEAIDNQDGSFTIKRWRSSEPARGPSGLDVALASARQPRKDAEA